MINDGTIIDDENLNNIITVYPNPFSEYTVIEFERFNHDYYTIQIIEMSGKLVKEYADGINNSKRRFISSSTSNKTDDGRNKIT